MTNHRAIPADLWSRTCATCGGQLTLVVTRFGDEWQHDEPPATAAAQQTTLEDAEHPRRVCAICGEMARTGYVVEPVLTALDAGIWAGGRGKPTKEPTYRTVTACRNRQACRNRLEARGNLWPVVEGEHRTEPYTGPRYVAPAPAPSAEPDPLDAFG